MCSDLESIDIQVHVYTGVSACSSAIEFRGDGVKTVPFYHLFSSVRAVVMIVIKIKRNLM